MQLHRDLQRCMYEIQQRDHYLHQLNTKVGNSWNTSGAAAKTLTVLLSCEMKANFVSIYVKHPLRFQFQQVTEEKGSVAAQLRAVSQTLRDTQNRCHWLEGQVQVQGQAQVDDPEHVHVCC